LFTFDIISHNVAIVSSRIRKGHFDDLIKCCLELIWSCHWLDGVSHPHAVIPTPGKVNDTPGKKASKPVNVELQ